MSGSPTTVLATRRFVARPASAFPSLAIYALAFRLSLSPSPSPPPPPPSPSLSRTNALNSCFPFAFSFAALLTLSDFTNGIGFAHHRIPMCMWAVFWWCFVCYAVLFPSGTLCAYRVRTSCVVLLGFTHLFLIEQFAHEWCHLGGIFNSSESSLCVDTNLRTVNNLRVSRKEISNLTDVGWSRWASGWASVNVGLLDVCEPHSPFGSICVETDTIIERRTHMHRAIKVQMGMFAWSESNCRPKEERQNGVVQIKPAAVGYRFSILSGPCCRREWRE